MNFIFFGTDAFSIIALETLLERGFCPSAIVTVPDKPVGRKHTLTPPPIKVWAEVKGFDILQPEKFDVTTLETLRAYNADLFIVASYGMIIPDAVLALPSTGAFNIHPSLLPLYRGPSPLQQSILDDEKKTGVSVIKMDEKMDHGPLIAQGLLDHDTLPHNWPPTTLELGTVLFKQGAELLHDAIVSDSLVGNPQDHDKATFTHFIKKADGELTLTDDSYQNFLKFQAFNTWPRTYFMSNGKRNVITEAEFVNGKFIIKKIIPEGKTETTYTQ